MPYSQPQYGWMRGWCGDDALTQKFGRNGTFVKVQDLPGCNIITVTNHCPLALRLPWPLQLLVVVIVPLSLSLSCKLLLSSSLSSSSRPKECQSQIMKLVQGGQHTRMMAAWRWSMHSGSRRCWSAGEDDPRQSTPFLQMPLGSISSAICTKYNAHSMLRQSSISPSMPSLIFSLLGSWWSSGLIVGIPTPPTPGQFQSQQGGRRDPRGAKFCLALLRGASNSSPTLWDILAVPPPLSLLPPLSSLLFSTGLPHLNVVLACWSTHHARPCWCRRRSWGGGGGTLQFLECPSPPWAAAGESTEVVASSPLPPSWWQGPTTTTTKTATSLSRRRGRRRGEDGKLWSLCLGHTTAEGPPTCHGGTWWATAVGLLVARGLEGVCPVNHGLVRHHVHLCDQKDYHDCDKGGRRAFLFSNAAMQPIWWVLTRGG